MRVDAAKLIKNCLKSTSIEDLKKVPSELGKGNTAPINLEALKLLEDKLSAEDYSEFYNNLKD